MERALDRPFVFQWEALPLERLSEWVSRRGVHGRHLTLAQFVMRQGYIVDRHSHPNEQITLVLRGALRLDFETGESYVLRDGEFIIVPPDLVHWGVVLEDTVDFDAFSPPRWDWFEASAETYYTTGNREGRDSALLLNPSPPSAAGTSALCVYAWERLPAERIAVGIERRSVRGQNQVFSRLVLEKGAVYEERSGAERALWVVEGMVRCVSGGGDPVTVRAGGCALLPKGGALRLEALEAAICVEAVAHPSEHIDRIGDSIACPSC